MLSKWSFFSNDHASAYMGLIQGYSIKKKSSIYIELFYKV